MDNTKRYPLRLTEKEIRVLVDCLYCEAIKSRQDSEINFLVRTEVKLLDALKE